ncbi:MAG: 1-(5-phosphoribosyl)-5-[(5-phosphoribosylamino)methylideneamino]imidazole-4-carboxamide isomerase [Verrucomicrobia bacterium]|nr:MAG: 1-(5-phosphoribosyl)-5-[(5-phosphoribosylamino)methylideneamino]imidazole-4-carboxamide isomerase [Verrucomicrobiota bacterium]
MTIYPAIDLKSGRCVRLRQGKEEDVTVYDEDPGRVAHTFAEAGAEWIHVVDLDGAFTGEPQNWLAVERILHAGIKVQLGGGIRDERMIDRIITAGVARVVIGTRASEDEAFVRRTVSVHGQKIAVGIDARDGMVAVRGWVEATDHTAVDLAKRMADAGVETIIYTDIATDGMLTGPNIDALENMLNTVSASVIASGGVSSLSDIEGLIDLSRTKPHLAGAIVGKAIYEGRVDLAKALRQATGTGV